MSNYAISLKRTASLAAAMALLAALTLVSFSSFLAEKAGAAQLTSRSLTLVSSIEGDVGGSTPANSETNGADTTHTFLFDTATGMTVQSIRLQYCTTAINACTGPTGLVVNAGTTITTQEIEGGAPGDAFAIDGTSTANTLNLDTAGGGNAIVTGDTFELAFDDITNPTSVGTFFVRVTLYSDVAWSTAVDTGTVAQAITTGISITSKVVETLGFSTTADDAGVGAEGGSCAALTGSGAIQLGDVTEGTLSITQAYDAPSWFRLYTNAANGVVVQYQGDTLEKGTDNIDPINDGSPGTAAASDVGEEQFGLAMYYDNATEPDADSGGAGYWGLAGTLTLDGEYDGAEGSITDGGTATFAFDATSPVTPKTIATSTGNAYVECDTAEVRYIGNISPLTPAGTYTTTLVYSAVPTY